MAGRTGVDLAPVTGDNPVAASPDLLRAMVATFAQALMGAKADALCGASGSGAGPITPTCGSSSPTWSPPW